MDRNKLDKLKEIGYVVQSACGNCLFGTFARGSSFGDCGKWEYTHLKHTPGKARDLSVNRFGLCSAYAEDPNFKVEIHGFAELKR